MPTHFEQHDFGQIPILGLVPESSAGSAPASPVNGQFWYDSTAQRLKVYQSGAWVSYMTLSTAETVTGVKTFSAIPLTSLANNQALTITGLSVFQNGLNQWRDAARFTTPTFETSPDGTSWTAPGGTTGLNVLSGRGGKEGFNIADTAKYVRYTWTSAQIAIAYFNVQRILLSTNYLSSTTYDLVVNAWSSVDGTTWTLRTTATRSGINTGSFLFPVTDNGGDGYYRIQIQIVGGQAGNSASLAGLELHAYRNDTGQSPANALPYDWDRLKQMIALNHWYPQTNNAYTLGGASNRWSTVYAQAMDLVTALTVGDGGTGSTVAPVAGGVTYGHSTSELRTTAAGVSGQSLKSRGASAPAWEPAQMMAVRNVGASGSVTTTDELVLAYGTGTVLTLPDPATYWYGQCVTIKITGASNVTVNAHSGSIIEGAASLTLTPGQSVKLCGVTASWIKL